MPERSAATHSLFALGQVISITSVVHDPGSVEPPVIAEDYLLPACLHFDLSEKAWTAHCPNLPGCVSEGISCKEALDSLRESIIAALASYKEDGVAPPFETWRETDNLDANVDWIRVPVNV